MEQILPGNWALIHLGLIIAVTCAQMIVVYALAASSKPPAGLGLYTVYFMAALLGWIAVTLEQGAGMDMAVDVPSVINILNSYILFLAAGQRAGKTSARILLGIVCLAAFLSVFFLTPRQMFVIQAASVALFFAATGLLCGWRGWQHDNIGDGIAAFAALVIAVAMPAAIYLANAPGEFAAAQAINFGAHSAAYALIVVGFLASVLIEYQHHLSQLATEDPLTRLLNRRGLTDALNVSLANASRHRLSTSAIMVDIDHFKGVNDNFGHEVGDHVIQQVADILSRMSRASDVVARTGGEEFLLVLPDTDMEAARTLAERIRVVIGERPLLVDYQRIAITVSLGVASVTGDVDLDTLAQEADRAMYLAKRGGRNRVASVERRPVHMSTGGPEAQRD